MSNVGGNIGNVGGNRGGGSTLLTSVQNRTQGIYACVYDATDGDGTDPSLTPLAMTATPSSSSSSLVIDWQVGGEPESPSIQGFIVKKDGVIMTDATDGDNGWSVTSPTIYGTNSTTSPEMTRVRIVDSSPTAGVAATYTVCARVTQASAVSFYLNRPTGSTGGTAAETTMSTGTITEYYA
jgi:hypothetical protein